LRPITIKQAEIQKEMYAYCREFPVKLIPHVTETGEVNDIIHHYKKPGGASRGADAAKPAPKAAPKPGQ